MGIKDPCTVIGESKMGDIFRFVFLAMFGLFCLSVGLFVLQILLGLVYAIFSQAWEWLDR